MMEKVAVKIVDSEIYGIKVFALDKLLPVLVISKRYIIVL